MDTSMVVFSLIGLMLLFFSTIVLFVVYSGIFTRIEVGAGKPPVLNFTVAYKYGRGPYKDTAHLFTEVTSIAPKLRCVGFYYDDPNQIPSHKLRWAVGAILCDGNDLPDPDLVAQFQQKDYRLYAFPKVSHVVKASFPQRTSLSFLIAIYRVYPLLGEFVRVNKLCAHPWMEIYNGDTIHFMAPLAKQDEFYVPEALLHLDGEAVSSTDAETILEEEGQGDGAQVPRPSTSGVTMGQLPKGCKPEVATSAVTGEGGLASDGTYPSGGGASGPLGRSSPPASGTSNLTATHQSHRQTCAADGEGSGNDSRSKSVSDVGGGEGSVFVVKTVKGQTDPVIHQSDPPTPTRLSASMPRLGAHSPAKLVSGGQKYPCVLEDARGSSKSVQDSGISSSSETFDLSSPASPAMSTLSDTSMLSTDTETSEISTSNSLHEFSSDSDNCTETETSFEELSSGNTKQ